MDAKSQIIAKEEITSFLGWGWKIWDLGVGEGQDAPTQIWEKREGEERGHMA